MASKASSTPESSTSADTIGFEAGFGSENADTFRCDLQPDLR